MRPKQAAASFDGESKPNPADQQLIAIDSDKRRVTPSDRAASKEARKMFNALSWAVSFTAGLGGFLFGYEIGIINQVFTMRPFGVFFGLEQVNSDGTVSPTAENPNISGWITFTFLIGAAVGALFVSYPTQKIGRKWTIQVGGAFFLLGTCLQTGANGIGALYAGRFLAGMGVGVMSCVVPLYISETAAAKTRGRLIAVYQLMITIGIFIATCVNSIIIVYYGDDKGDSEWRLAMGMQFVPCVFMMCVLGLLPYSPRWLYEKNRPEEAAKVLARLRRRPQDDPKVVNEINQIAADVAEERRAGSSSWPELFRAPDVRYRTFLGITLQFFQQWTGINIIMYFGATLFAALGFSPMMSRIGFPLINGAVNMLATLPGMWLIERIGRRWLMIIGGIGMGVSHILVTVFGAVGTANNNLDQMGIGAITFILLFVIFFGATWGPVVWVYQSEIFPLRYRAKGTSASTVSNWTWNAVVSKVAPLALAGINYYTYLIWGGFCICMALFAAFCVPETKGLTLEQVDEAFGVVRDRKPDALEKGQAATGNGTMASSPISAL